MPKRTLEVALLVLLLIPTANATLLHDAIVINLAGYRPAVVAVGDVTGDDLPDVVLGETLCAPNCHVLVLAQRHDGTLTPPIVYPSSEASSIVVGDLNGDGRNDVAIANRSSCGVQVFYQQANGSFGTPTLLTQPSCAYDLATADLMGNGKTDLIAMPWGSNSKDLYLYIQNASGGLDRHDTTISGGGYDNIGSADINGDGIADVFVASPQTQRQVALRLGTGNGQFGPEQIIPHPWLIQYSIGAGDFNGDGKLDLVVGGGGILLQQKDGSFTPLSMADRVPDHFAVADLDGDGRDDIISGPVYMGGTGETLDVWLQRPGSTFVHELHPLPKVFSNFHYNKLIAVADINHDGLLDVVMPMDGGSLLVWYGSAGRHRAAGHH